MIGLDESDKFYWKHEMFLFQKLKKIRYNRCYISAHDINQEKTQKCMFLLLINDSN